MRILIVDDEEKFARILAMSLKKAGHAAFETSSPYEAIELANKSSYDLVLSDIRMPQMDGLELIEQLKERLPEADLIMMTAFGTLDSAITAMRLGVSDYLLKPFKTEQLLAVVNRIEERRRLKRENQLLRAELSQKVGLVELIGQSNLFLKVVALARKVAPSEATILIRGASGTGKELMARLIHSESARSSFPMVTINCGAIPETLLESELFGYEKGAFTGALSRKRGKVELASGGTLFLDEIGELAPSLQVKLLRFLQEKTYFRVGGVKALTADVRILAATNRDLEKQMATGSFREDLYYRLNVVSLLMPSLCDRRDDIPALAKHFLDKYGRGRLKLTPEAIAALSGYHWPGNVRELENVMERASVVCEGIDIHAGDLPFTLQSSGPARTDLRYSLDIPESGFSLAKLEQTVIEQALELEKGVKTRTARRLGITRRQLDSKLKKYDLD